ncbi:MAG TPA: hypothetical protein VMW75_22250 [Thermoanaerobaculia bacterium]|nr:hypothetical protein [Thermoanaerobaculia bacterium]
MIPTASAPQAVDLTEFECLRKEIDNRTQIGHNIILAQVAMFGAGISLFDKLPDVLVGLAFVPSLLWLLWLDNTLQVFKLGTYIATVLAPRLSSHNVEVLGWERFRRLIDSGESPAVKSLFANSPSHTRRAKRVTLPRERTRQVAFYTMPLFAGCPLVLMALYPILPLAGQADHVQIRLAGLAMAFCLWVFASVKYWRFERSVSILDYAIAGRARAEEA